MALESMVKNHRGSSPTDVYCAACENICHTGGMSACIEVRLCMPG